MVSENSKEGEFVAHVTVKDLDSGDNGEISLTVSLTLLLLFYLFLFYLSFFSLGGLNIEGSSVLLHNPTNSKGQITFCLFKLEVNLWEDFDRIRNMINVKLPLVWIQQILDAIIIQAIIRILK